MYNLPLGVKREIGSFGMFAPDLPVSAAAAMIEHIKAETDHTDDTNYGLDGVSVKFAKCGIRFIYIAEYEDEDDVDEDSQHEYLSVTIRAIETRRGGHVALAKLYSLFATDDCTVDGLIRLIHKFKPEIRDIEERGFCSCREGEEKPRKAKLAGSDMCGQCAFNAAMGAPTK